jgi:hypothetical protein
VNAKTAKLLRVWAWATKRDIAELKRAWLGRDAKERGLLSGRIRRADVMDRRKRLKPKVRRRMAKIWDNR